MICSSGLQAGAKPVQYRTVPIGTYEPQRLPATERRARETYARSAKPLIHEEELPMKTYSKPTLKKHASLKQVTFSSH